MVVVSGGALRCAGAPLLAAFALLHSVECGNAPFNAFSHSPSGNLGENQLGSVPSLVQTAFRADGYGLQQQNSGALSATLPAAGAAAPVQSSAGLESAGMPAAGAVVPAMGSMMPQIGGMMPAPAPMVPPPASMMPGVGNAAFGNSPGLYGSKPFPFLGGPVNSPSPASLKSRSALGARVPVYAQESGEVLNGEPVVDTRTPVGFYPSASGTYMVPRFPSSVQSVREANEEMNNKCLMRIPATKMTSGFSDTLKRGGVQISGNAQNQLLHVVATTSPRYTSKLSAPYVLYKRATGTRITYDTKVAVSRGCVLLRSDPSLMAFVRREGDYIVEAMVQLHADTFATYMPSAVPLPSDLIAIATNMAPNSNFQPVGHCVFVAHFTASAENIQLLASHTQVRIEVLSQSRPEMLELEIPVGCLPQSMHRVALWTTPVSNGTVVVAAMSPPPVEEPEWFIIRSTSDESAFNFQPNAAE